MDLITSTTRLRHVMVCLDRSLAAERALPVATSLARAEGAELTLLYVLDASASSAEGHHMDALEREIQRAQARLYMTRVIERLQGTGLRVQDHVTHGVVPERIISLAVDLGVGLLVLATRGWGEAACRIGGTAHKVLELAPCPVLTVPSGESEPVAKGPLRRILVPLDGSVRSQHVLPTVLRLAGALHTQVVLATAIDEPVRTELLSGEEDLRLARELTERMAERAETYLARIRTQMEAGGVTAVTRVQRGSDHRAVIEELARAEEVDLTVMSAHGASCDSRRRFGTLPPHFMAHSESPLLVLQDLRATTRG